MTPAQLFATQKNKAPRAAAEPFTKTGYLCSIKTCRANVGLSVRDVSDALNLKPANVSQLECNGYLPPLRDALKLAEFFGVKIEDLWVKEPEEIEAKPAVTAACTSRECATVAA